ncbi:MAG: HAD-IIIC family phosphatase [Acidobacteriota bacterium]|nr:HAD-IIIC family phosphatase [Acidobacteriota bacterium]
MTVDTATPAADQQPASETEERGHRTVKLLIWDLDNTLWDGTLLEGDDVQPRDGVVKTLETLDERGILQSVASKNDHAAAMERLKALGLDHYFLYPMINWSSKASNIEQIVQSINIGMDTVAFIDDQPFERDEVSHSLPEILTLDADEAPGLAERSEFQPRFITDESSLRRQMYQADIERKEAEEGFVGPTEEFLASLDMHFTLGPAQQEDLQRAEELTMRTHQLNTTGYTYDYDELDAFRQSDDHLLLIAGLVDRYGTYGKIGLTLVEKEDDVWHLRLLLMSCRVMSRGVGTIMLQHVLSLAKQAGVRLLAEFRSNDRNRMMLVTYKFSGFKEIDRKDGTLLLEHDLESIQPFPDYVEVVLTD